MNECINRIRIVSTGRYLPKRVMTNYDFEKIVDTSNEWIVSRTGIQQRRMADDESASDLAYQAAKIAIEKVGFDVKRIDLIICATITPDVVSPAVANLVQAKLGLNDQPIMAFDVNAACTGFIYALNVAAQMLNSGRYRCALVIGTETLSRVLDFSDRSTCVLFGDGAGAMIIEATDENKPAYFYARSEGDLEGVLVVDRYLRMNGKRVYQFAIKAMQEAIEHILETMALYPEDLAVIIPHQANIRIIQSVAKTMGIMMDKFYTNIDRYGNTSAASVIIALDEYLEEHPEPDQRILLVAFGAGFTWGSALITT